MVLLNKRQNEIVAYLATENDWIAANRIAESFDISVSTLRRDIEVINESFIEQESQVISKPGLGLRFTIGSHFTGLHACSAGQRNEIFATKRLVGIVTDLLTQAPQPLSISTLSEKYFVSRSSIVEDLKKAESWLENFSLHMFRDHTGTYIKGDDLNIRVAMKEIIAHSFFSRHQIADSRIDRFSHTELVEQFGKVNVENCISLMSLIERDLSVAISEPYYTNLFSHLLVTIKRAVGLAAQSEIETFNRYMSREWTIAEKAVSWLEKEYNLSLPEIEVSYIYQYIISSGHHTLAKDPQTPLSPRSEADEYADKLISCCSHELGLNLRLDKKLHDGLALHIKPMLNRLAYGIAIHNPLLDEIKHEFLTAFSAVTRAVEKLVGCHATSTVSEDEIAYLTLYIQAALDKFSAKKKIIIVCSSGVGTSQLLASRINRAFPEWEIVDIVPGSQLDVTLAVKACDLIISTIKLEGMELPVAYVSALFSKKDIARISEKIIFNENMKEKDNAR
ncbi:BglG family transcription antiterminator [Pantoea rwandensis]|uniref:Uncharacterized protein n=1 Tax=Pantoea rwandensis TaxID=1076550 RepID=A0A1X1D4Z6_9GAMM|nr:PRD domain-containing protein [Pantoea rwandensis]ORM71714.1 hypothetical protein HA51_01165 [Pantoea rwandensis]